MTTPTLVDRVKQAILDLQWSPAASYIIPEMDDGQAECIARAVIEAMREPTDAMVRDCCNGEASLGHCITDEDGKMLWQAMIDAALSEPHVPQA